MTSAKVRSHFKETLDEVSNDSETVIITRQRGKNVVMMSEEDYRSYEETAYLMQSLTNYKRILDARKGKKRFTHDKVWKEFNL